MKVECTAIDENYNNNILNDNIAIVIPAYNAHATIKKLFHSIALFSFLDKVQVCLIDDNSNQPYDYLYALFPEIKLTILKNKENKGPGYSRNQGIQWVINKEIPFIMFADADDYFINFNFWEKTPKQNKEENTLFLFRFYDEQDDLFCTDVDVWSFGKIYKTNLIKNYNIYFSNNYSNEDVIFNFIYFNSNISIYKSDLIIYHWTNTKNSLSRTENYDYNSFSELIDNLIEAFLSHKEQLPKNRIKLMILNRLVRLYYYLNELLGTVPTLKNSETEKDKKIWKSLNNYYHKCYKLIEEDVTQKDILFIFNEINQGNNAFIQDFIWMDFYSFLNKIKEG